MEEVIFQGRQDEIDLVTQILDAHSIGEYEVTKPDRFDGKTLSELFVKISSLVAAHWPAILAAIAAAKIGSIKIVIKGHTYNIGDKAVKDAVTPPEPTDAKKQ